MLDDIGLGSVIANLIYLILAVAGVSGVWLLLKNKLILGAFFWVSLVTNGILYLYFMGKYSFYPKSLYLIINEYWPWINLVLFILLIINFIKNKNKHDAKKQ